MAIFGWNRASEARCCAVMIVQFRDMILPLLGAGTRCDASESNCSTVASIGLS